MTNLTQRADDIVALIDDGNLPQELAAGTDEGYAQLVGTDGEVLGLERPISAGAGAAVRASARFGGCCSRSIEVPTVDDDLFRALTRAVPEVGVCHVGTTYDVVAESAATLISAPGLDHSSCWSLALAALIWWLVGGTLRPVEDIRVEGAEIEATDLGRRVPQPGTNDEIDRLAATMNDMLARLETGRPAAAIRRRCLPRVAQPADRLRSELEVDMAEAAHAEQRAVLRGLLLEVLGMQVMVEDLLFLARSDAGRAVPAFHRLDLDDLVLEEAKRIQSHQRVEVDLSTVSGAQVSGDPGQLTRAIRNLMDNAERHAASRVKLSLQESGEDAVLLVADDGPGIPDQEADRIFERFTRLDEARTASTGGPDSAWRSAVRSWSVIRVPWPCSPPTEAVPGSSSGSLWSAEPVQVGFRMRTAA